MLLHVYFITVTQQNSGSVLCPVTVILCFSKYAGFYQHRHQYNDLKN